MSDGKDGLGSLFDPESSVIVVPACVDGFDCASAFVSTSFLMFGSAFLARFRDGREPKAPVCKIRCLTLRLGAANESVRRMLEKKPWMSRWAFHHLLTQRRKDLSQVGKNYFLVKDSGGGMSLMVCTQHLTTLWKVYTVPPASVEFNIGDKIFVGESDEPVPGQQ